MRLFHIILISVLFLLLSCSNDDDQINNTSESLVFGTFAGECAGNCFNVFKIDTKKLEEDEVPNFFTDDYVFISSFTFSNEQFATYRGILDEIPLELIEGNDKRYGCPDCADQGGFYFVITTKEGEIKKYTVDTNNTDDQSVEVIAFKSKISEIIKALSVIN